MMRRIVKTTLDTVKALRGEALRYVVAGVLTTLVNVCLFTLMTKCLKIAVTQSNVTAISISIIFAYFINKLYVFKRRNGDMVSLIAEFCKFCGSRLFTMALEVGTVWLLVIELNLDELFGKLCAQVIVVTGNYVISKTVVFRRL